MLNRVRLTIPILAAAVIAAGCSSGGATPSTGTSQKASGPAAAPANPDSLPRNETLYTSGTQWGPPANFNPLREWDSAVGTKGLIYETLFHYDTTTGQLIPWLAQSGSWTDDTTYEVKLRPGITWSDGQPFTAEDVAFTYRLGKMKTIPYHNLWEWLKSAEAVDDSTVKFTFSTANYQEWDFNLYNRAIVPQHLWKDLSEEDVLNGANDTPVGTGAYTLMNKAQDRVVLQRRDDWWGKTALNMEPKPTYIVDIVNSSNEVAMGLLLQKGLDISNNFLPGITNLVNGNFGISTYYPKPPYMLSANTTWMVPNTTKKPMNDVASRHALATAIDTQKIVKNVYSEMVKAADPTGMLPQWDKFIDKDVVAKEGYTYSKDEAKKILAGAGYKDTNGDGLVENKDGSKLSLKLAVPTGWTDWMEAARSIAADAKAAGIDIQPDFPDYNALVTARNKGDFDIVLNNDRQLSNSPFSYYQWIYQLPIIKIQNTVNFGRFEDKEAWDLVKQLDQVKTDDVEGMNKILSKLQERQLTDLPVIPLWFNGLWSQVSNQVWKNWPSSEGSAPKTPAVTWRNWWEMGGFKTLTQLQPAAG
jgi:peptide/nickel transport system substrate-binding protein